MSVFKNVLFVMALGCAACADGCSDGCGSESHEDGGVAGQGSAGQGAAGSAPDAGSDDNDAG
jgi:hypothetical protein